MHRDSTGEGIILNLHTFKRFLILQTQVWDSQHAKHGHKLRVASWSSVRPVYCRDEVSGD